MDKEQLKALMQERRASIGEGMPIERYFMACVEIMFDVAAEVLAEKAPE